MALTKKDLSQVKGIVRDEVGNLARIVARGFEQVDKRFEGIDKRLELIDKRLERIDAEIRHINARLDMIEHDLVDIKKHFVYRGEFEEVLTRLVLVEKKLGIKK